ncbi:MFS transporter [Nocardiopsis sp. RSe5-2]|uniref:MFS transporter n=1 Tax=Nocardiopsis endophytica TaxID=3018445 RepID=A0ABT4U8K1_9ACTN|nr:MFS transporter [Nocardiopsis endophytica]MDA2813271.1 MFS transporter [Nocardiopsis endophytica]
MATPEPSAAAPQKEVRAGPKEWAGLTMLALPTMLLSLDLTVLYMAIPHLGGDLGASSTQLLWIMDIYGFVVAGFLITMGTLGDRIGRRRLLLIGAAAFGVTSVIAAYSVSAEMLIAARALLGLAGATLMPPTMALLTVMFKNPKQRAMAISVWLTSFTLGGVIGPAVGGALLEFFWWGSVFLLAVPVMVLLVVAGPLLLPEYRDSSAGRLDLFSVALSLGTILPFVYGLKEIAKGGFSLPVLAAVAVSLLIGWAFVRRQFVLESPLLDMRLFRSRTFTGALVALLLGMVVLYSFTFHFTQFLQLVQGLEPLQAGVWFVPLGIASVVGAMGAPILARSIPPARLISFGLVVCAAGFVSLTLMDATTGLAVFITGSVVAVLGAQPMLALGSDMVVSSAPPEKTGSASAMSETGGEFGAAMGIAVFGSLNAAVYGARIDGLIPEGVPEAAAETTRNSFAGALSAAEGLPADLGAQLVAAGRDAFVSGMNAVTGASAAVMLLIAVVVAIVLRHVPPLGQEEQADQEPEADQEAGTEKEGEASDPTGARG